MRFQTISAGDPAWLNLDALIILRVPGIGKVSERCLESLGVMVRLSVVLPLDLSFCSLNPLTLTAIPQTCADIFKNRAILHLLDYGVSGLLRAALGVTSNHVQPGERGDRKSIGCETSVLISLPLFRWPSSSQRWSQCRTFRDKSDADDIWKTLQKICVDLHESMVKLEFTGRTLSLKYKRHDYKRASLLLFLPFSFSLCLSLSLSCSLASLSRQA